MSKKTTPRKSTYHDAITGKFVSKQYAQENPDTTVEITNCNLRQEMIDFYALSQSQEFENLDQLVNHFLKNYK